MHYYYFMDSYICTQWQLVIPRDWVTTSILKSPVLKSISLQIQTTLCSGQSLFFLECLIHSMNSYSIYSPFCITAVIALFCVLLLLLLFFSYCWCCYFPFSITVVVVLLCVLLVLFALLFVLPLLSITFLYYCCFCSLFCITAVVSLLFALLLLPSFFVLLLLSLSFLYYCCCFSPIN